MRDTTLAVKESVQMKHMVMLQSCSSQAQLQSKWVRRGGIVTSRHNTVWLLQLTGSEAPISNCDGPSHPSKHAENKEGIIFDFQEYNFCFSYLYYEDTTDLKKNALCCCRPGNCWNSYAIQILCIARAFSPMPSSWYCCHVTVHDYQHWTTIYQYWCYCVFCTHIQQSCALQCWNFCHLQSSVLWSLMEGYVMWWKEDNPMELNLNPPLVSIPHVSICHGRVRPCTSPSPNVTQEPHSRMFEQASN